MVDQQRLRDARHRFSEGAPLPLGLVPDPIAQSWARSRASGLLPWHSWQAKLDDQLHTLDEADLRLAACVRPELDRLWQQIGGSSWTLFCVNPQGVIVHARQSRQLDGPLLPLQIGRRIQEVDLGTTAPACTLAEGVPMVVIGHQHYLSELEHVFCVSVPVRGLGGEIIGALDITGVDCWPLTLPGASAMPIARRSGCLAWSSISQTIAISINCSKPLPLSTCTGRPSN